jgi:uncharacterized OsmC-like protein
MLATTSMANNGVNVGALLGAREALAQAPEAAQFRWRTTCTWMNGTHSHSTVQSFFGLGGEQSHKARFSFDADHPELFAAEDNGPTPVEYVLHALAACLTAGIANIAAARNIKLTSVESTVEGDIDLLGILGLGEGVRNGFQGIKVSFKLTGDDPDKLRKVVEQSRARSAVYDIVTNGVPVEIEVEAG